MKWMRNFNTDNTDRITIQDPYMGVPPTDKTDISLEASLRQLEGAGVAIAILESGEMRVVHSEEEATDATERGFTIYSAKDLYFFIQLEEHERRLLHSFKKQFGGAIEWKEREGGEET